MQTVSIEDILTLKEGADVEFKKACGANGEGKLPKSFWETYSAFANTYGGVIFLGIGDDNKVHGIKQPEKVKQEIFDQLNNREKISADLLREENIEILQCTEKTILKINIPQATRKDKPVYINGNPLTGTYIRKNEGDYRAELNNIKKMLSEQQDEFSDSLILPGYGLKDLNLESVKSYRNLFSSRSPTHPFLHLDERSFLQKIGAWKQNRENNSHGLTKSGLIMFGNLDSILDYFPNYIIDYQEHDSNQHENRWIDRITTDGSWSGNVYDFYIKCYGKLRENLKIPFEIEKGLRVEDTNVHKALREALVNSIIHADYNATTAIKVIKKPGLFEFTNPGKLRLPRDLVIAGGNTDCRNRSLQKMFQFIGAGEQAGSGVPQIFLSWKQKHWRLPRIIEQESPERTIFRLHTVSLLPQHAIDKLDKSYGLAFRKLNEIERVAMVLAETEGLVDHSRIKENCEEHSADISKALIKLVKDRLLNSAGTGRGKFYFLKDSLISKIAKELENSSDDLLASSDDLLASSDDLLASSDDLQKNYIGAFEPLTDNEKSIKQYTHNKKKIGINEMRNFIYTLCKSEPITLKKLSYILNRTPDYLRQNYLNDMIQKKEVNYLYPDIPKHPEQAYQSNKNYNETILSFNN